MTCAIIVVKMGDIIMIDTQDLKELEIKDECEIEIVEHKRSCSVCTPLHSALI